MYLNYKNHKLKTQKVQQHLYILAVLIKRLTPDGDWHFVNFNFP